MTWMRRAPAIFVVTVAAILSIGCSPARLLDSFTSTRHFVEHSNLKYGNAARQTLDLYLPSSGIDTKAVVVFVYGGGWRSGSRQDYRFVANSLTKHGYAVAIPDYAQYPRHRFPVFVDDIAHTVKWIKQQAEYSQIDPENIVLIGHSAGAHVVSLVANDGRYLHRVGLDRRAVKAWIGIAGPYDFYPFTRNYMYDVFPRALREDSQPINFIDGKGPPTLLLQGRDDRIVDPRNSIRLHTKSTRLGADSTLKLYNDIGHRRIIAAMSPRFVNLAPTLTDILAFLSVHAR